ncbi:double-strand break repair helicase AddA [Paragemmobacter straminiformis]|uniref:DNA 3'-5' helicase n=1 Tax=Paragemmobacter straminiformis TaxID=2045119 RepID=A0A842I9C8_9RHOB|nr:double-strand break repair helicase AddA [Gemmobacter straminiformis]MBC2836023.1 double-strand break repair helicase AddA [Gemmobacter straminiformis]
MSVPAFERQVQASMPDASTWLSANAGSGKTRVLTDRVARLLLKGVEPQHILCLTYTKAAATEMQNRLFKRLGEWAMLPDADLRKSLAALGEAGRLDAELLLQARRLFARAIETPGGLRIQTIHSFCATLLRRFPLEAQVSPQFRELDDRTAKMMRNEIVEELAEAGHPSVAEVARAWTGEDFGTLIGQIVGQRAKFAQEMTQAEARLLFGVKQGETFETLLGDVFLGDEGVWMPAVVAAMAKGSATDVKGAERLAALDFAAPTMATLLACEEQFLFKTGEKANTAKIGGYPTKDTRKALGAGMDRLEQLMGRVEAARVARCGLMAMERAMTLHRFAQAFLPLYEDRKARGGWLDFDDLITRARMVLTDPGVAAWVLFRLDGGIDHILVDEAQDTSPEQWRVIESLAAEFTAGRSARDVERTLFVVGDKKQSIYSFQGADVAAFDAKHGTFEQQFRAVGRMFQNLELEYSFRSSPAILRVVDETLKDRFPHALGDKVQHIAFRGEMAGRVDLWPLIEKAEQTPDDDWKNPVDLVTEEHHFARLAGQIADEIKAMIDAGTSIPLAEGGSRPVHAGDFLILVQRRSDLFQEIIRACKARGLAIAGADRLKLGAELAVRDIAALLAFLATPEDDLSLAAVLRSPLCGWSEAQLFALAQPRKGYLWQEMRQRAEEFAETFAMLSDLLDEADFLRPFDLIERALTRHDGRRRLLARLGAEAEDGIDELLSQALQYEQTEVPSLTGFLTWLSTDEVEVKRQMDSEGQRIRVMTVHGAKGLEAPIVILPDTGDRKIQDRDEVVEVSGRPVWRTPAETSPPAITAAQAERRARVQAENLRLLYVALTRARVWLIVCGAGEVKTEGAWWKLVEQGMKHAGGEEIGGGRLRHAFGDWPDPAARVEVVEAAVALPDWAGHSAAEPARAARLLSPSDLGGAKAIAGDGLDEDAAKARGTALHLLLEHLPDADDPAGVTAALVPDATLRADLLAEAQGVIAAHPALFDADPAGVALAEVVVTADLPQGRMLGTIDRLLIGPDRVLAVDYKSNRVVPKRAEDVPEGILRQMGAYAEALRQLHPEKRVEVAVLWTRDASLMPLDPEMLRAALLRSTIT